MSGGELRNRYRPSSGVIKRSLTDWNRNMKKGRASQLIVVVFYLFFAPFPRKYCWAIFFVFRFVVFFYGHFYSLSVLLGGQKGAVPRFIGGRAVFIKWITVIRARFQFKSKPDRSAARNKRPAGWSDTLASLTCRRPFQLFFVKCDTEAHCHLTSNGGNVNKDQTKAAK